MRMTLPLITIEKSFLVANTKATLRQKRAFDRIHEKVKTLTTQMEACIRDDPELTFDIVNASLYGELTSAPHDTFLKISHFATLRQERNRLFWNTLYPLLVKRGDVVTVPEDCQSESIRRTYRTEIDSRYALSHVLVDLESLPTDFKLAMSLFSIKVAFKDSRSSHPAP